MDVALTTKVEESLAATIPEEATIRDGTTMMESIVRDPDDRHFSNRDHDHDHFNRHRVFRNGVWFWAYGPDYYAGDNCAWLLDRAEVTGGPYWWRRYNLCIGYY